MVRKAALAVAQVLLIVALASGQTALGTLRGTVLDEQGGALPGATVTPYAWPKPTPFRRS